MLSNTSDIKLFQSAVRRAAQANMMAAERVVAEALADPTCDPEFAVKVINANKDVAQAVPEKKLDPHAGLVTINIVRTDAGGVQITSGAAPVQLAAPESETLELAAPAEP